MEISALNHATLVPNHLLEDCGEGVGKHGMGDQTVLKESRGADTLGAVNDLRGEDKVAGLEFLAEGSDGREGNDGLNTEGLEGGNVGTCGDFGGGQVVATAVTGQECNMETRGGLGDGNSIARLSPRLHVHVLKVQLHSQLKN